MKNHYKKMSLTDVFIPEADKWSNPKNGFSLMQQEMTYYFAEAESYRKKFGLIAESRARNIENFTVVVDSLSHFYEPRPAILLMEIIYKDFAAYQPTIRGDVVNALGVSARKSQNLINNLVRERVLLSKNYDEDNRTKILVPSVGFVVSYERRTAKSLQRRHMNNTRKGKTLEDLREFDVLRKKYYPTKLFELVKFDLDKHAAKLRLESGRR
jgi:hypothetical protein